MRKLKTPEEIIISVSTHEGFNTQEDAFKALIIAAQRDALECVKDIIHDIKHGHTTCEEALIEIRNLLSK